MYFDWVSSECQNSTAPAELSVITAVFSSVLLVITVPTNLFVCLAILIDPNKELRTQFNCFTFNLALADLLVGCITESISVYAHVRQSLDDEFGHGVKRVIQKVLHIPYFVSAVASVLSIAALALERYLAITSPFLYRQHFNVRLCVLVSIAIWVIALSFGAMNIFLEYILESFILVNSALFFTGVVVCLVCFRIRSTLRKVSNNWKEIGMQSTRRGDDGTSVQKTLTKTFAVMIGALMCCYIPVCCMVYYMNLCESCDCSVIEWLRDFVFWLILLNSAVNPFIYALRTKPFRNAVRMIIRCKCRRSRTLQRQILVKYAKDDKMTNKRARLSSGHEAYGTISTGNEEENSMSSSSQEATIVT